MSKIYRMGSEAPPGVYHSPGNPDVIPTGGITPPPPPPPSGLLAYGTTLFGQSYARYKEPTLTSGLGTRYTATENDTVDVVGGVTRKGSAVIRVYGTTNPGVYTDAHPAYLRSDQPTVYSYKIPAGQAVGTFKSNLRAFLDSKNPATTPFLWFCIWHEPDNDWFSKTGGTPGLSFSEWVTWQVWTREVLKEAAYTARTDYRFGMITTGGPWGQNQAPLDTTGTKGWLAIWNAVVAARGGNDTWDYLGIDRYNPAWNGTPPHYMLYADWAFRVKQAHAQTGLPFVVGEAGSARADVAGMTVAQQDLQRASWWNDMCTAFLADGFYDAVCWWKVPAVKNNAAYVSKIANPFSTIMITPTGYNATLVAAGETPPPGGTDAQAVVDMHSSFCIASMQAANPTISFQP